MKRLFRRLPLPVKLLLIGVIPMIFLLVVGMQLYREKTEKLDMLKRYIDRNYQSAKIGELINTLQEERRFSFDYAMHGQGFRELELQRNYTDTLVAQLERSDDPALTGFIDFTSLDDLNRVRNQVDSNSYPPDQVMHYYSNMIFRINTLNTVTPGGSTYLKDIYADMVSQRLLTEIVTYFGLIRANFYNVLYTRRYVAETLMGTLGAYHVMVSYETEFRHKASPQALREYNAIRENTALEPAMEYMNRAFSSFTLDSSYNAVNWWAVSGRAIDRLVELRERTWSRAEAGMRRVYKSEKSSRDQMLIYLLIFFLALIAVVAYVFRSISIDLRLLKKNAERIAEGETIDDLTIWSNDAIGSLTGSIARIDENSRKIAKSAESIGKGDFSTEVPVRGEHDLLGNSIVSMKENLQHLMYKLEESRNQFEQLADSMPQIVWTARPDGENDYYNKQWYRFTGTDRAQEADNFIRLLHPDDVQRTLDLWYDSVKNGSVFQMEYRLRDKKLPEGYRWFLARAYPVRNNNNEVIKWFGTSTDIHDRKMISEKLELKVQERTSELRKLNEELERSNYELEQFAYVASHDLQEPLRKIQTFSKMLENSSAEKMDDQSRIYLEKINTSASRLSELIDALLNFSRLSKPGFDYKELDLNEVIQKVLTDFEVLINNKSAVVNLQHLPVVKAVPVQMNQLFHNLIGNALKFSSQERLPEISIVCRDLNAEEMEIFPELPLNKRYFCLEFKDNGIGFDKQYSDQIFMIFQRLHDQYSYPGSGIGLALCRKIVMNHHGKIFAESEEGKGTKFTVVLPYDAG